MTERRPSLLGRTLRDESARPLRVSPLTAQLLTVGVDIGGTKVAAGVVTHEGEILDQVRRETPDRSKSPQVVEDTIVGAVLDLAERHEIHAVGIGAAGFIDAERANVLFSPHLSWRNEPLREAISSRLRLPVVVENDANAAVWAEWRFGAGRGESHLVCVNLGHRHRRRDDRQRRRCSVAGSGSRASSGTCRWCRTAAAASAATAAAGSSTRPATCWCARPARWRRPTRRWRTRSWSARAATCRRSPAR